MMLYIQNLNLYAEVNGKLLPVAHSEDGGRYVVSWTEEHNKAPAGDYKINIMDEDGFAALKKVYFHFPFYYITIIIKKIRFNLGNAQ